MKTQKHTYQNTYGTNSCSFGIVSYDSSQYYVEVTNEIKVVSMQRFTSLKEASKRWNQITKR